MADNTAATANVATRTVQDISRLKTLLNEACAILTVLANDGYGVSFNLADAVKDGVHKFTTELKVMAPINLAALLEKAPTLTEPIDNVK